MTCAQTAAPLYPHNTADDSPQGPRSVPAATPSEALGRGYVHVYTGDGKGKTTAALGLVLRAYGAGLRVLVAQFMKRDTYSEIAALARLHELVTVRQYGAGAFVRGEASPKDVCRARAGLAEVRGEILSGRYDLVVLDEANMAAFFRALPLSELLDLIDEKPHGVELVLTGRRAAPELLERADLVTEMREIKHYFRDGVSSRRGVEA